MTEVFVTVARPQKVKDGKYSLRIHLSEYNPGLLTIIKALPVRYYDAETKSWEVPLSALDILIQSMSGHPIHITQLWGRDQLIEPGTETDEDKRKLAEEIRENFTFKTKPYDHQLKAFSYGLSRDRFLLGDEMGLGKTKEALDIAVAKKRQNGCRKCLIICGVNSLKWNWLKEVETHTDEGVRLLGQKIGRDGSLKVGENADKAKDVALIPEMDEYFIVTNVETLRDTKISDELSRLCLIGEIGMVVFDEAHKCKDPRAAQTKGLLKLQAETMIAMTGTPLINSPMDLYVILKWLRYEQRTFFQFKDHFCVMGGYGGKEVVGYKNTAELESSVAEVMLRRKKEDVLDLPEKVYIDEYVDMTSAQSRIYREIREDIRKNVDRVGDSVNPLTELLRLRQATGYTGILSSEVQESAKLDRMKELVDEAVSNGKKVVVFSNWTEMTDVIMERLSDYRCALITGQVSDKERQEIVDKFQAGEYDVVVGSVNAVGTGLTLTAATVEIFVDEPWTSAIKEQCVDRCHRIGQSESLTIYTLMCRGTIDVRVHGIVQEKSELAENFVDGKISRDKRKLVEYLIS